MPTHVFKVVVVVVVTMVALVVVVVVVLVEGVAYNLEVNST